MSMLERIGLADAWNTNTTWLLNAGFVLVPMHSHLVRFYYT